MNPHTPCTEICRRLADGSLGSRQLAEYYLSRIDALNHRGPCLGAVIETDPGTLAQADVLDRERRAGRPRGLLHGLPVLVKDNIATRDPLQTTAGSLALEGYVAPDDAPVVAWLRAAGALILGKTNLSEWANFRSSRSLSGWSSRGGQTRNPHALDRTPWGSSSGSAAAVAADLCSVALGTETDGSVVYPAAMCGIVGLKPTVGLLSRTGVIPLAHSQDTVGPMARSVADLALLLTVLAGVDPADPVTLQAPPVGDYRQALDAQALRGARLGVARQLWCGDRTVEEVLEEALRVLARAGAILVDPVSLGDLRSLREAEMVVLHHECRADLNAFLATLPAELPVHDLDGLIAFNRAHRQRVMPWFGQDRLERAAACGSLDKPVYREALADCRRLAREQGIDRVMAEHGLDAILAPTAGLPWKLDPLTGDHSSGGAATPAAVAGYPHITVPAGFARGLPVGLSLFTGAFQEARLLALAHAFECSHPAWRAPNLAASLDPAGF